MIQRHNKTSLAVGLAGLLIQVVGGIVREPVLIMLGAGVLIIGLVYYAKAKGRNPAWGLMGLWSIVGYIVLACLKDLTPKEAR